MRWKGRRGSQNVEDRRSMRKPAIAGGGLIGIVIVIIVIVMGGDPRPLLQQMQNNPPAQQAGPAGGNPAEDELAKFVAVVLADTEEVWGELMRKSGKQYREPKLVLFPRFRPFGLWISKCCHRTVLLSAG